MSIESVEISITTWVEKADVATKLEYSASDIKKVNCWTSCCCCQRWSCQRFQDWHLYRDEEIFEVWQVWKIYFSNPSIFEPVYRGHQGPRRGLMRRERRSAFKEHTEISVSAIRAAEILFPLNLKKLMRLPNYQSFN